MTSENETIRAFWAVPLNLKFQKPIEETLDQLKDHWQNVRWVNPDTVHVTLCFLPYLKLADIDSLNKQVETVCNGVKPLELGLRGVGFFPHPHNPKIIWLGIDGDIYGLSKLQSEVKGCVQDFGYELDPRPFRPHATLGRVSSKEPFLVKKLEELWSPHIQESPAEIDQVSLYQSLLGAEGAKYEVRATFMLDGES